jgi:anti-anti-sigma regulatory factor
MSVELDARNDVDIRVGKVIWPKSWEGPRSDQQQRSLLELLRDAGNGLILDCSGVEVGTSELVTLLMRIRNHATKSGKEFALFNVPNTLFELVRICNLQSILPIADDAAAAKKLVSDRLNPKPRRRWWPW